MTDYYQYFDSRTNNGRVHAVDISTLKLDPDSLTTEEAEERRQWVEIREELHEHYAELPERERGSSPEDVLCERVVPPELATQGQSRRYHGGVHTRPKYPRRLHYWEHLKPAVESFRASTTVAVRRIHGNLFVSSFQNDFGRRDEAEEQTFLKSCVFTPLARAGLLPSLDSTPEHPAHGVTDFNIADGNRVRIVVESKSTHSLPLPMDGSEVIRRFINGRADAVSPNEADQAERQRDKLYVADTIGQLLRYMLLNGCRYGALTSGTRTYFVCILDDDSGNIAENVFISDAWFVGEENYLRAWAYIYALTAGEDAFFPRPTDDPLISWASSDESFHGEDDEDEGDDSITAAGEGGGTGTGTGTGTAGERNIPHVRLQDIRFEAVLGYGRNGSVMRATWNGKQVAVKQFDCGREGVSQRYEREVKAYEMMKDVQGLYIPKAFFVSELPGFGIKYLGLQLGRDPSPHDTRFNRWEILSALRDEYGIKHSDCVRRNGLIIADRHGKERLVMIDWEEYEFCHPIAAERHTRNSSTLLPIHA